MQLAVYNRNMTLSGKKVDPVRLSLRRLLLLGLLVLAIFALLGVWSAYRKERESATLRAEAESSLADLTAQRERLEGSIAQLQTDRGREAALRQQYAVGKKGERLIMIVEPATSAPQEASSTILQKLARALWLW